MTGRTKYEDWRALDFAEDPDAYLRFLDAVASLPLVVSAKRRSLDLLGVRPGHRVLDAGCGTGADAIVLAERVQPGGEVVGIDSSEIALDSARKRAAGRDGVVFRRADLIALPFPDSDFDGTRADRAIQHVAEPEAAISELFRVTRPGGAVVVTEATFSRSGAGKIAQISGRPRALLPFLPLLMRRAGALEVRLETSESTVEPGREILEVLHLPPGPIELRVFHIWGRVQA